MEQDQNKGRNRAVVVIIVIAVVSFVVGLAVGPKDDAAAPSDTTAAATTDAPTTTEAPTTTAEVTTTTESEQSKIIRWSLEYMSDLSYFTSETSRVMGDVSDAAGLGDLAGMVLACSEGLTLTDSIQSREMFDYAPDLFRDAVIEYDRAFRMCVDFDLEGATGAINRGTELIGELTAMMG